MTTKAKTYWERNIRGFAGFYDKGSEEALGGPAPIRYLYRTIILPIEKHFMKKRYQMVRSFIDRNVVEGTTAADVGCGSGVFAIIMAEAGGSVVAYDFAESALDLTRENIPTELKSRVAVAQLDISRDPIPETVEVAIAIGVLPYIADVDLFVRNMTTASNRVLFNFLDSSNLINRIRRHFSALDPRSYYYHDPVRVAEILRRNGLEVLSSEQLATGKMIEAVRRNVPVRT